MSTAPGQLHRAAVGTGARAGIGAQVRAVGCWTPIVARRWEAEVTGGPYHHSRAISPRRTLAHPGGDGRIGAGIRRGGAGCCVASVVRGPAGPVLVDEADGAVLLVVGLLLRTVFTVAPICSNSTSSLEPVSRIMGRGRGARF